MPATNTSMIVRVYDNGDHTCLVWLPPGGESIPDCRGFVIRKLRDGAESYLHGVVGFVEHDTFDPAKPWTRPLQRFMWWDYFVNPGDSVRYAVIPVVGSFEKGTLTVDTAHASALSPALEVSGQTTPHLAAYFNKGIVAAQWVTKELKQQPPGSKIRDIAATPGNSLRNKLSGLLRPQILSLLSDVKKHGGSVYAALYELNDPELIAALKALGANCHVILANGAFKTNDPDENAAVRDDLRHHSQIQLIDRLVTSGHFAHNKFVVFCDSAGQPRRVLTGSTNWTSSGLCTQANNGLIIDDEAVAADFLAAWKRLAAAGNGYPTELVDGNDVAKTFTLDGGSATPWHVKTSAAQDLVYARKLINAATEGMLFLFFNPGPFRQDRNRRTLLQDVLARTEDPTDPSYDPNLYVRGVVNQSIAGLTNTETPAQPGGNGAGPVAATADPSKGTKAPVTLYQGTGSSPERLGHEVLIPANIKKQFFSWQQELLGASMVNVHSKVIVLDPFGDNPVVMTGSHNLGFKASSANDDNLVIIQGNAPLAVAYAMNIIAIFQSYRWNRYVEQHRNDPKAWHGPVDRPGWQYGHLRGTDRVELDFWLDQDAAATPAPAPAATLAPAPGPAVAGRAARQPARSRRYQVRSVRA